MGGGGGLKMLVTPGVRAGPKLGSKLFPFKGGANLTTAK